MEDTYLDMHICLGCKQTILGLDAYIQHKRYDCSALKSKEAHKVNETEPPLPTNSSSAHFNCDYSSTIASNISSDEFKDIVGVSYSHLSSLLEAVTSSVSTDQSSSADVNQTSSAIPCATQSSVDLAESIVLYTTENCSFFDSLQLKSKAAGGKSQTEDKFKNLQSLNSLECPMNKDVENEMPFLPQSKQLDQLCSLTSPVLKIESDLFESSDCNSVLTSSEQKIGQSDSAAELCESKSDGETLTLCWKSGDPSRKESGRNDNFSYDHAKALQIACMFNSLEFESDSDDFMPTDADDLLNFSDMEDDPSGFNHSNSEDKFKERNAGGGKLESYKHSGKLDAYVKSQGKLFCLRKENSMIEQKPPKCHTRGKQIATKWRPGERPTVMPRYHPHTSRGKWQGPEECEDEEQEEPEEGTDAEDMNDGVSKDQEQGTPGQVDLLSEQQGETYMTDNCEIGHNTPTRSSHRRGQKIKPECKNCNKVFSTKAGLEYHLKSNLHMKRIQKEMPFTRELDQQRPCVKLECTLCDKIFLSKFSFARHLLTPFHSRRARYNEKHKLVSSTGLEAGVQLLMQRLQHFQCRICDFYANEELQLANHLTSSEHSERVDTLTGPFICVRCQYICHSNDDMINHVSSTEHANTIKISSQPCVLKEKRCKIACPKCDVVIHSALQLASHQRTCTAGATDAPKQQNSKPETQKCSHCSATFMTKFNLTVHVRRLHTKDKPFHCRTCEKAFADNSTLKLHRKSKRHMEAVTSLLVKREEIQNRLSADDKNKQNRRGYHCKQCDFVAYRYSDVVVHRAKLHVPPDCAICGIRFGNRLHYDRHMMSRPHIKKEEESKISSNTLFTCDKCPRKFYTVHSMKMHEMNHQLAASRVAMANGPGPDDVELLCYNLKKEPKLPNGKVECPKCGKYLTKIGILPHLRAHAGSFPFQCTFCGKKFVDASIMRRHLKVHLGIRSYRCKFCSREFDRRLTLDAHLIREHKDSAGIVPSHLCNICGHKFIQLNQLNAHLKFHDKSVRCPHPGCSHSFRYRSEMLIHMQVHTKETRFLCDECGYAGKTRTQLSRHRRVHTGEKRYKCSHCSYSAAHIANLKRHERVHTGNKPYQCPHCKYSCNTQENLRKHILKTKRHAGQSVYPCPHCEFGCNSATEFQSHLETEHNISRNHLPSIVAGLYQRDVDARSFSEIQEDQSLIDLKALPANSSDSVLP